MTLLFDTSALWLEIPDEIHTASWQQSESIELAGNRWQAYCNQMSLHTVLSYLQEAFGQDAPQTIDPANNPQCWSMVNGSVITVGETRFVIVPTEAMDKREFWVPQEWIDIPSWIGDYYLAVEVNPDDRLLQVWGYTTHAMLKSQGVYDESDRAYCLNGSDLIQDIKVLWVVHDLGSEPTRAPVAALPPLTAERAEALIQQLEGVIVLPRLEVPFVEWGALLGEPDRLQQLCQQRERHASSVQSSVSVAPDARVTESRVTQLSRWFQSMVETGWQTVEELLTAQPELEFSFRAEAIADDIIRRVKCLRVGTAETTVLLLVMLQTESEQQISIRVRLLPTIHPVLPAQLTLALCSTTGDVVQSVQTRDQDNSIQLKRFRCPPGMPFRLAVSLDGITVSEDFVS
ncbi:DUF1822 family protein [Oscillatoria sp. FACHB-1407]|uniref:DUF1822 family protein n=1 Tax=Oscillatoria sp. FACHB-1407 TaxID=2692847 RepID=UPI0016856499|nr:DUF1822 family protein [Oscillatoria sp. FACHB-1407]MBD2461150.1 DUF1822 family protein [Oscillatoria sp. FACHB-1407]